ncbi:MULTISPECIES: baseplate protein [Shewanella]|uniref:baseplate protein n=1 Tax=Shewanella TaxID=22 RepID=UPI001AAEBD43|nr:baseplate protein [Shewanella algae]MBO2580286.1 baseplate protein [Shewanella algae]HDS1207872.1 baseplate protein [Shewanella algae]
MATGHDNAKGNIGFLKSQYTRNKSAGEKALAFEFLTKFIGYDELSVLVRSAQLPATGRTDVEDYGPMGLMFVQHGALENSGEITLMVAETIKGVALKHIRDIVLNKKYVDIEISLTPESTGGKPGQEQTRLLRDCKIRSDVIELSTEDQAAIVKPTITVRYNWID